MAMTATAHAPLPPHPRDVAVLGSMPDLARGYVETFVSGWRECGDVVRFRGPRPMCIVAHPDDVRRVLVDREPNYPRSPIVKTGLRALMGNGLFLADAEAARGSRPAVSAAFDHAHLSALVEAMTAGVDRMLDRWQRRAAGAALDVRAEMTGLTLAVTARAVFGDADDVDPEAFRRGMIAASEFAVPFVMAPVRLPPFAPSHRRYRRTLADLDGLLLPAIAARRRRLTGRPEPGGDLITLLLGAGLDDRRVRDEVLTAVFGAFKGVPDALAWTWYLLSKHPHAGRRVRSEAQDAPAGRSPTLEDLGRLRYTAMVVDEVLRLYPPLWILARGVVADDEIRGYRIRPGLAVLICPYVTHRHPAFWDNPEGFLPERFAPERAAGRHPYAYLPFGAGPRACVGEAFSRTLLKVVVAMVSRRFRLDLVPGHRHAMANEFVLRPDSGMPMTLAPATGVSAP